MNVTFAFLLRNRKRIPRKYWSKLMCAAGVGALQSLVGKLKKKVPGEKKISVLFTHPDGSIDWYPPDQINPSGVLIVPAPLSEIEWELYCSDEDQKKSSSSSSMNSS